MHSPVFLELITVYVELGLHDRVLATEMCVCVYTLLSQIFKNHHIRYIKCCLCLGQIVFYFYWIGVLPPTLDVGFYQNNGCTDSQSPSLCPDPQPSLSGIWQAGNQVASIILFVPCL